MVPDNAGHCPLAKITLIVCILRGPYEHSLAFTGRLRSHLALVNYFVVFGVTQRVGLILKGGGAGVEWSTSEKGKKRTSGNRTAGVSKIKQGSSVNRNRKAHPGKGIQRLRVFFFLDQTSEMNLKINSTPDFPYIFLMMIYFSM